MPTSSLKRTWRLNVAEPSWLAGRFWNSPVNGLVVSSPASSSCPSAVPAPAVAVASPDGGPSPALLEAVTLTV